MGAELIRVQVVQARADRQLCVEVRLPRGASFKDAVERSGFRIETPYALGSYGRVRDACECVREGERIEIYRALINDPRESRRRRARQGR